MKYCPYYCEENIWHLCQEDSLLPHTRKVIFISNKNRCVAIRNQNLGSPVHWDYHVVLLYHDTCWKIADLDTTLPFPCPVEEYLSKSFTGTTPVMFSAIDAEYYIAHFASDRRHMINQNEPPPPWGRIGTGFNLWKFVDGKYGQSFDLDEMYAEFGE